MGNVIIESDLYKPSVTNVLVNGKPVIVNNDVVVPHFPCPHPETHCYAKTIGTSKVLVNGKPLCTSNDVATCGHPLISEQTIVFAN